MTDSASRNPRDVRLAGEADREAVVRVLTAAFFDDPLMAWVFPRAARRRGALRRLFEMEAEFFLRRGLVWLSAEQQGAATWLAPGVPASLRLRTVARHLPAWLAAGGPWHAVHVLRAFALTERKHPKEPHYYLGSIGVEPAAQGQGLGGSLIEAMTERIDAEGMPTYLLSSNARNVPLYERHGFRVTEALKIPHGGPTVWSMWRTGVR